MTHDDELIERVAKAIADTPPSDDLRDYAQCAITAVRAYDAERRASVLDVDALKSFDPTTPGTLVWLPDGLAHLMREWNDYDPDDYRDLPVAMTGPVRFEGGLTTDKRR